MREKNGKKKAVPKHRFSIFRDYMVIMQKRRTNRIAITVTATMLIKTLPFTFAISK